MPSGLTKKASWKTEHGGLALEKQKQKQRISSFRMSLFFYMKTSHVRREGAGRAGCLVFSGEVSA